MRIRVAVLLAGVLSLGGCTVTQPPTPPPETPLTVVLEATVNGFVATINGCITGGNPPYQVLHSCNSGVICAPPGCPVCPSAEQVPCPPQPEPKGCFQFECAYEEPGTYTVTVVVLDADGEFVSKTVEVTVTAPPPPPAYTITATAEQGGSISPSGSVTVLAGDDQTFRIRVFVGYTLGDVLLDGVSVLDDVVEDEDSPGVLYWYTIENVQADHTLRVLFGGELPPPPPVL